MGAMKNSRQYTDLKRISVAPPYRKRYLKLKSTGIVRNIDELGRIVVPKEIRTKLSISPEDPIEIYVEDEKIILVKDTESCIFCGKRGELAEFKGKKVCPECISEIK